MLSGSLSLDRNYGYVTAPSISPRSVSLGVRAPDRYSKVPSNVLFFGE